MPFHTNKKQFDPQTHVKVRIVSDVCLPYDFVHNIIRPAINAEKETLNGTMDPFIKICLK